MSIQNKKLREYELLFETNPDQALRKMVDIFPLFDPYDAESIDAIWIWMYEKGNTGIADYIRKKIQQDSVNKKQYQFLLKTITRRFRIHFRPRPLDEIIPVGQEPDLYLSWFFLTDGELWITAGEYTLYEYSRDALKSLGMNTEYIYNEYYQSRFLEDFTDLFPYIRLSLPENLYQINGNRPGVTEDADWINDRTMYSGHLQGGPLLSFFRYNEKLHICWETEHLLENGLNLWTAPNGNTEIYYNDFVYAVKEFINHFFICMDQQVETALLKDWGTVSVDKEQLVKEHTKRKETFSESIKLLEDTSTLFN